MIKSQDGQLRLFIGFSPTNNIAHGCNMTHIYRWLDTLKARLHTWNSDPLATLNAFLATIFFSENNKTAWSRAAAAVRGAEILVSPLVFPHYCQIL